ncbi:MAG: acyl-CoA dehydrogenase family protein [Chlorobi bacterium]|nr:acyl-CoA dehydrogenase family protein [Chlorobiota bacterium]MCI0715321.1 acyl-CoA dehydrogenase family protein [Chlorobiota bacterium]
MSANFKGVDYFNIDALLSEEEKMIRETTRDFVNKEVIPIIEHHNQAMTFPKELIPQMAELGFFGPTLPAEYGGLGMNNVAYGLMMAELERGDSGLRSFASVQSGLVMYPIYTYGSEEQKKRWLPAMAKGEKIGCFGLTEPDYGSNPGGMITTAKKSDGGYILNGAKMWITNSPISDVAVVWAKLDGVVNGFLVERDFKGFSTPEMKGKLSLRASITGEIILQDVFVPEENRLPNVTGLKGPLSCLNQARYGIAWGVLGAAMECYVTALEYSLSRIQFDRPIAAFQITQEKLVWMLNEITKGQLMCYKLGRMKDEGTLKHTHVSMAKRNNCEFALTVCRMAREILGANGILDEYPVMRHANNLESVKTYEGTHEMHTLIIGEDITGIPAFRADEKSN